MNLNERLNKALAERQLQPKAQQNAEQPVLNGHAFRSLEEGIKAANTIEPDDFGTRVIIVEKIEQLHLFQLPMPETIVHKYVIDDIQKRNKGGFEVHLVEADQNRGF